MLRTLGGMTLEGSRLPRKPSLALCYLALEGPQPRRRIAELLWPAAARPRSNLSVALSTLRRAVPGAVHADRDRVATTIRTDADELRSALERRDIEAAVRWYRGPFLHAVDASACSPEVEEWIAATREALADRLRSVLLDEAARQLEEGDLGASARLADRAYRVAGAAPPLPDDLERLHRIFASAGHPAVREVVREANDLGLVLAPVHDRSVATAGSPRRPLPSPPRPRAPLVGRDVALADIAGLLDDAGCRLLTLSGPGGIGKSRLAQQVAHEHVRGGRFTDGVAWVDLESLPDGADPAQAVGRALGVPDASADPKEAVTKALAARRMLLILDGADRLAGVGPFAGDLIEACPELTVLVTSRERILTPRAFHYRLEGLALPGPTVPHDRAAHADPVRLFVQCARRADARFRLEREDVPHVVSLCRAVGGSPLGIELAAAWVRAVPLAELAAEAHRDLAAVVGAGDPGASDRPGARAGFERSWRRLDAAQRRALARLSVFTGGFDVERARRVAETTLPTLAALVDASLLRVDDDGRYDRHALVHAFARERLAADPMEERRALLRHAETFLRALADADPDVRHAPTPALLDLERDFENLRAAWRTAIDHGRPDLLAEAALPLARLCDARARFLDGASLFAAVDADVGGAVAERGAWRRARTRARLAHAWILLRMGRYDEARARATRGVAASDERSDPVTHAWALHTLATVAYKTGRYAEAEASFEELRVVAVDAGDVALHGEALGRLALVAQAVGRDDLARARYGEALDLARRSGDDASAVTQLLNLGALELNVGRNEAARHRFEEGRRLAEALGYEQILPILLHNLANVTCKAGDHETAIALARDALDRVTSSGERGLESGMLATLGWIEMEAGDLVAARRDVHDALRVARIIGDEPAAATALVRLAQVWVAEGRAAPAARALEVAIDHPATLTWARRLAERLLREVGPSARDDVDAPGPPDLLTLADGILAAGRGRVEGEPRSDFGPA